MGIIFGLGEAFFWVGYNFDFTKFSDTKNRMQEVKVWFVLVSAIGIAGPLIGGFLLSYLSFYIVFVVVILLFILSIFPLLHLKKWNIGYKVKVKNIFRRENFDNSPRYFLQGLRHLVGGIFWPIFIFYFVKEYFSLGAIIAGATLFSSFAIWVIGDHVNRFNRKLLTDFGGMVHGVISFIKVFISSFGQLFFVAVASHITYGVTEIAVNSLSYDQANKTKSMEFFIFREFMLSIGRVSLLVIILFSGLSLISSLKLGFIILGATSLLQRFF